MEHSQVRAKLHAANVLLVLMRVKARLNVLHALKVNLILILALNLQKLAIFVLLERTMNLMAVHCHWSALLAL